MSSKPKARSAAKPSGVERLVEAAQALLAEKGLEGLNSNAVAERAGLTPPTFYHYFPNKHALLRDLGERMLSAQSTAIRTDTGRRVQTPADLRDICRDMLGASLAMSRAFTGGFELLVALRAIPELRDVRLRHQERMAVLLVGYFAEQGLAPDEAALRGRARLALHLGYAAVEMLFETDFANEAEVLDRTAEALAAVLDLF
jgi:AcrR family transcriptional regulator